MRSLLEWWVLREDFGYFYTILTTSKTLYKVNAQYTNVWENTQII